MLAVFLVAGFNLVLVLVAWSAETPSALGAHRLGVEPGSLVASHQAEAVSDSLRTTSMQSLTTVYLPLLTNRFRAQTPVLGIAMEAYADPLGLQEALSLRPQFVRRWQPLSWEAVERVEGQYDWSQLTALEAELAMAYTMNFEPIIEIQYSPIWARTVPGYSCSAIRTDKFEKFADFMEQVVLRYGSSSPYGVRYWQLGNEPDVAPDETGGNNIFGCWGDPNDPYFGGGHYAEMLKVVYPRIKAADPEARVLIGGLLLQCDPETMTVPQTCANQQRWLSGKFLEGILKAGGGDYFDVADIHSYAVMSRALQSKMTCIYPWSGSNGGTGIPEKVGFARRILARYGYADKPLLLGEAALKCQSPTVECNDVAAAFIPRMIAESYDLKLDGAVYYLLVADHAYYALMSSDLKPRPVYTSYVAMSEQLINSTYIGAITEYPGVSAYEFQQNGIRHVQIAWSTDGTTQTIVLLANFVRAFDKYGTLLTPVTGTLDIGWSPIYLEVQ
jgi:hypothetical protein